MVGHQAVGVDVQGAVDKVVAKAAQEEEIVFAFEEDFLAVVASIVEVIILAWEKLRLAPWHRRI